MQAQLLPTVHNISSLHLPAERLTQLAKLQQWVKDKLGFEEVPITNGSFVLVSAADLSDDPLACSTGTAAVAAATTGSSAPAAHAAAAAMPLRLRQVAAIQVPPGVAAADGVCVLEGGQSVRVGAVVGGRLQEVPDPQVRPSNRHSVTRTPLLALFFIIAPRSCNRRCHRRTNGWCY